MTAVKYVWTAMQASKSILICRAAFYELLISYASMGHCSSAAAIVFFKADVGESAEDPIGPDPKLGDKMLGHNHCSFPFLFSENKYLLHRQFTVRFRCLLDNTSGFIVSTIQSRQKRFLQVCIFLWTTELTYFSVDARLCAVTALNAQTRRRAASFGRGFKLNPKLETWKGKWTWLYLVETTWEKVLI